jgi:nitrate reductase NapE component
VVFIGGESLLKRVRDDNKKRKKKQKKKSVEKKGEKRRRKVAHVILAICLFNLLLV